MNDVAKELYALFPDNTMVVAGGAARDWETGNPIKDYDVFITDDEHSCSQVLKYLTGWVRADIDGIFEGRDVKYSGISDGRIDWVIKCVYRGHFIDFIKYKATGLTPETQVELFDCTINMVWFDKFGHVWYHPRTTTGGTIHYMLEDNPIRMAYLQRKFPHSSFIPFKKEPTCAAV